MIVGSAERGVGQGDRQRRPAHRILPDRQPGDARSGVCSAAESGTFVSRLD
jgi:hypothetical protein